MIRSKRALALLMALLVTALPACYSWRSTELSPQQLIVERRPDAARLVFRDGSALVIREPEIVGAAIVGVAQPRPGAVNPGPDGEGRVRMPLAAVVAIEERHLSAVRTAIALGTVAVVAAAILVNVFSNRTHGVGCSPTGC